MSSDFMDPLPPSAQQQSSEVQNPQQIINNSQHSNYPNTVTLEQNLEPPSGQIIDNNQGNYDNVQNAGIYENEISAGNLPQATSSADLGLGLAATNASRNVSLR